MPHASVNGINIFYEHKSNNIQNCDVIVYSPAVNINNVEILSGHMIYHMG